MSHTKNLRYSKLFTIRLHGECTLRADNMWRTAEDGDEGVEYSNLLSLIPAEPTARAAVAAIAAAFSDPTSLVDAWRLPLCVSVDGVRVQFDSDEEFAIPTETQGEGAEPNQDTAAHVLYERRQRLMAEARLAAAAKIWKSVKGALRAGDAMTAHFEALDAALDAGS